MILPCEGVSFFSLSCAIDAPSENAMHIATERHMKFFDILTPQKHNIQRMHTKFRKMCAAESRYGGCEERADASLIKLEPLTKCSLKEITHEGNDAKSDQEKCENKSKAWEKEFFYRGSTLRIAGYADKCDCSKDAHGDNCCDNHTARK